MAEELPGMDNPAVQKRVEQERAKSRGGALFPKLVEMKGQIPVLKDQLPAIFHAPGHLWISEIDFSPLRHLTGSQ